MHEEEHQIAANLRTARTCVESRRLATLLVDEEGPKIKQQQQKGSR